LHFWPRSQFAYRSSKAAVNMVVRSLAIDLTPLGITCVVVNLGWVRTDMGGPHATLTQVLTQVGTTFPHWKNVLLGATSPGLTTCRRWVDADDKGVESGAER
jgi:NAD(P)-dependent dehydrogenase (short-subunit alcohol dehydrogenase family)